MLVNSEELVVLHNLCRADTFLCLTVWLERLGWRD